jgi:hypothetical protein
MHFIVCSVVSSQYALKYTPKCTPWHTCSLLDYMLPTKRSKRAEACSRVHSKMHFQLNFITPPSLLNHIHRSKISRRSQVHFQACSQLHTPEARHSWSNLAIWSHVFTWVLNAESSWVPGTRHLEAGVVLATGLGNLPVLRARTAKTVWFGSKPGHKSDPPHQGRPNPDMYPSIHRVCRVLLCLLILICSPGFRVFIFLVAFRYRIA